MRTRETIAHRSGVSHPAGSTKVQVLSAVGGVATLIVGLWWLHTSEISNTQFVLGMIVATGLSLTMTLGGFVVAARRNSH